MGCGHSPALLSRFLFPAWTNHIKVLIPAAVIGGGLYATVLITWGASPKTTDVGYQPLQPVPYSHALHAGDMGIDCRYCHTPVEGAAHPGVPPTQTCMNCHARVRAESAALTVVRESLASGLPVPWVRVHDLPDYAYFDHSAHVHGGVGCVECHGRVDAMAEVWQVEPLSMGWCLDCHRDPAPHLRPPGDITNMAWVPAGDARAQGEALVKLRATTPPEDCASCHR
ncbi:MAG: cytochrome c3 family protein [Pseudomonadota bacterium]